MTGKLEHPDNGPLRVPRRATAHREGGSGDTRLLADWRSANAYVLLGDPGSGKSCTFEDEARACNGLLVMARDIVDRVAPVPTGERVVFIDALDEVRAGASDGKAPFGAIREWLHRAGRPRFRLSCREADWLGESDRSALERVAPDQRVEVLHLQPLQQDEVFAVLRARPSEVPDPDVFWEQAERFGLTELFGNPLLLDLTIKAVTHESGNWPATRREIYEAACRQLATETSTEHQALKPAQPGDIDRLLNDAGMLCAVLLLSNKQSWALQPGGAADSVQLSSLPATLPLHNARAALASKVFTTVAGHSAPRHRSIAEFLAAKALAKLVDDGLPLGRVLALMQGFDGRPVDPLRGLFAWLAVHDARDRARLIEFDPLGVVLNGDVAAFGTSERLSLLEALNKLSQSNPWFHQDAWVSHPFGALATADMEATYEQMLRDPKRTDAHQSFIDCVLRALTHGERMPALGRALQAWVEDASAWDANRLAAYQAWKHNVDAKSQTSQQLKWLQQTSAGTVLDADDELTGALLMDLYPQQLGPREVLKYLHPGKHRHLIAEYSRFWHDSLLRQSRPQDFSELADAWVEVKPTSTNHALEHDAWQLSGQVLAAALAHAGDDVNDDRLFAWLGLCVDEHSFSKLTDEPKREVAQWLELRPDRMKAVLALGYQGAQRDSQGHRLFWEAEQRLHGARQPPDWLHWLLDLAATTKDDALAEYCFRQVAPTVLAPPKSLDVPTMQEMEQWVEAQAPARPAVREWLTQAWSSNRDERQGEHRRRQLKHKAQQLQAREERRLALEPYLATLTTGTAPAKLLHEIALAHDKRFTNIHGDTPLERVQDFLVSDAATAQAALAGIDQVLERQDLPTVDEIFTTDAKGKYHFLRPAALLAAARAVQREPNAPLAWTDNLAQKLVAFYLTDGTGNMPAWYRQLAAQRPGLVAPILSRYAGPKLRHKGAAAITGLWALSHEADQRELAQLVLPKLLTKFPARASEASRRELNRSLLAALYVLDDAVAAGIIEVKLARPGLDPMQRVSWLVADLPYRANAADELVAWVGKYERRGVALGIALNEQGSLARSVQRMSAASVQRLIDVLAPITPRKHARGPGANWVTVTDNREDTVRGLISALSSNPDAAARDALRALKESDRLGAWKAYLDYSVNAQQAVAREAQFQVADPMAVALTMTNAAPANAFDLQALVIDQLRDMEAHLRGSNTHLVRQFWRDKSEGDIPRDENSCRDLLMDKLQGRFDSLDIHIEREASAAQDKRADMRVEFRRSGKHVCMPIEVKKEDHSSLWTAWRDQLQHLYTIDPAAGGCGLYLVLWFGRKPRSTPEGAKPRNAQQMHNLIVERIPQADRHRLAVQVLDLSLPGQGQSA